MLFGDPWEKVYACWASCLFSRSQNCNSLAIVHATEQPQQRQTACLALHRQDSRLRRWNAPWLSSASWAQVSPEAFHGTLSGRSVLYGHTVGYPKSCMLSTCGAKPRSTIAASLTSLSARVFARKEAQRTINSLTRLLSDSSVKVQILFGLNGNIMGAQQPEK